MPAIPLPSRQLLALVMLLTALGEASTQLIVPSLGAVEAALRARPGAGVHALSAFVAAFGLGQLLLGPLSDRIGRRPVLIGGLLTYLLGTGAMLLAGSLGEFIGARVLQGLGACACMVLARTTVRDVWKAEAGPALAKSVIGMLSAVMFALMLGGLLHAYGGWRAPIVASLLLGLGALAAVVWLMRESNLQPDPRAGHLGSLARDYADLLRSPGFPSLVFAIAGTYGAMFAVIAGSSAVYVGRLQLSPAQYGLTFGSIVVGLVAGAYYTQRTIARLGPRRLVARGLLLVASGALLSLLIHQLFGLSVAGLSLPQLLVTLGGGMVLPASIAGAVIPNAHRAGLAAGFMGFAQMLGATCSGLLLSALADGGAEPMLRVSLGFALAGLGLFHFLRAGGLPAPQPADSGRGASQ
ncbi:MFS transporter [Stutzerimonas nosocomialis]|uniref:MFS transporter n=1 Tax=Stutzerimonas nosocomialis TaxID=1056496 RepID=UPI0011098A8B|nr:MFS transporter [Stutzerimonas nosocomialis]TLX58511.1 MFS transporter [Stutzerimonas nosocomialis]